MKVTIDAAKCMGHGMCYSLAPNVFTDDDHGYGQVVADGEVSPLDVEAARNGAANCPEAAISVTE
ncbi:ferredoxin [Mycobacterium hubeiense]|uniref:ferredoxin n=1 Tax=Mycobacterium hubeiense TaxID=1867256 RepID=UPI000C7F1D28|nr:ferredoxin [Mycobacterium sp. QGD 101]